MKFSESWLRELVDPALDNAQLAELLTMAGLEVEGNDPAAPIFDQVVVAQVVDVRKHENAEKLNVCKVDAGQGGELLQIVCGAPNVAPGVKVPCALVGANLPGDFKIKEAKLRGVESFGMLCSARELGVSEESDGLLLLPGDAPVGASFRDYYQLDDRILTLKLTPNRADCLSLTGIAREVAALTAGAYKPVAVAPAMVRIDTQRAVRLEAGNACPRYAGRVIQGVNAAAATPAWMKRRLERSGVRSISALVDITNYVLMELGQPMHAFDNARLQGDIVVRMAKPSESLELLNGKQLALETDMLVIADASGPVALAGIMGGMLTSVRLGQTQDVFLESAFFSPSVINGKARRLGFGSDSSYRYERGVDFGNCRQAMERATELILAICGGNPGPITETLTELPKRAAVSLRVPRVARVLGIDLGAEQIIGMLKKLGLQVEREEQVLNVVPSSYRFDINIEEDLIEEVARLYGYDNLPTRPPVSVQAMLKQDGKLRSALSVKLALAARDYQEIVSYAFVEAQWEADFAANNAPVKLLNPIASQMSVMRSTLIGGLVSTLITNLNRKHERVRLFEVARVFHGLAADEQPEKLAGLAYGSRQHEQWGVDATRIDFYDVKADVEALLAPRQAGFEKADHPAFHPGRCAQIVLDGQVIGVLGELHPKWVQNYDLPAAPVLFEMDLAALIERDLILAKSVSKLQPVRRDLAFVVDDAVQYQDILDAMASVKSACVTTIEGFDVYRGKGVPEGKKSLAFKVVLQDTQKTLSDAEIDLAVSQLVAALQQRHDAQLRS
ncbi:phenylalanine--tRNA ligase subunit beta [Chitinimonas sp. BJB300]|uniref:phenylalanine--tRNA ligase subunit beta n=1 Tax=Chitinimonas sp. BJB300 TaxID=1559339 RepID=UPI000C0E4438|nr:phenylalanine--tRNA ligase subunit beta [Chitinimonas sp. BJB300]PHV10117.1 phenylalanine--tRNA ligase subunit beta [Chitinimonas sp. BJB300]TSJ87785.1 phenylalanine--tRNA ligase subunit beta [Chitinimonas sp. BJB300]